MQLNQRGLAILLRRIISFLPCSQRQLPHTKQTHQQQPGGNNVKSACDAAVWKLESASQRMQDPHKDSHKVKHKDGYQSHQSHCHVDTNCMLSSTGTAAIHWRHPGSPSLLDGGAAVTHGSHDGLRLEPPCSGPPLSSGLRLLEARHHMSHHPVAAHRTDGHSTLLVVCPCEPGRTSRIGGCSCTITAFMTVLIAWCCPGAPHHSSGTTPAARPCFLPLSLPLALQPLQPMASASQLHPTAPIPVSVNDDLCSVASSRLICNIARWSSECVPFV